MVKYKNDNNINIYLFVSYLNMFYLIKIINIFEDFYWLFFNIGIVINVKGGVIKYKRGCFCIINGERWKNFLLEYIESCVVI